MYTILKPVVWVLLFPINLFRWLLRSVLWIIALPFRLLDAIFKAPVWFFRWLFSLLHRKYSVPATILRMWQVPAPFATSIDSFVLFESRGEKIPIRLNVYQTKRFFSQYSQGDVGTVTYRGKWLVRWKPATIKEPVAVGAKNRKVFLSYSHDWKDEAQYVAKYLGSRGVDVWFDEDRLNVGDALNELVIKNIRNADYFIPMLSQDYCLSEWCVKELEIAFEAQCKVLPVKVEEGELMMPPNITRLYKEDLGDPVFADLRKHNPIGQLDRLFARISK